MQTWKIDSWRSKNYLQRVNYPNDAALQTVLQQLSELPSLVPTSEIIALNKRLVDIANGKGFLIQGGDCTESFTDWNKEVIAKNLQLLIQQSAILNHFKPQAITLIARAAGLYAKPRTTPTESQGDKVLLNYRGDMINQKQFDCLARQPDPQLMKRAYQFSQATINEIKYLQQNNFNNLINGEQWTDWMHESHIQSLLGMKQDICEEIFVSREALILEYEQQFTRKVNGAWYNCTTHFPWIGMRTLGLDSAHVEYMRGIANPVAIKVGASISPESVVDIIKTLNPDNRMGRLSIIHRYGLNNVQEYLPQLILTVQKSKQNVVWMCDPMHGNSQKYQGIKTRDFEAIMQELLLSAAIHQKYDTYLGGIHLEMTGDDVTECYGGPQNLQIQDLSRRYRSPVDPRLNKQQALALMWMFAKNLKPIN